MSELDRHLDELGARLAAAAGDLGAAGGHSGRADVRRRRALLVAPIVAALAAVALAISWSRPEHPPRPLNAIAEARAALSTKGAILYVRVRTSAPGGADVLDQWSTEDPLRWRTLDHSPYSGVMQEAYGAGVTSVYYVDAGLLNRTTGYTDDAPQARLRSFFGTGEPDRSLQALLAAGKLVDKGDVHAGNRTVRRLEHADEFRTVIYDVDPKTFAPVGGSFRYYRPGHVFVDTVSFTVERYERIPLTRTTARLLTITPKPAARVTTLTSTEFLRRSRALNRWLRHCRTHHLDVQACRAPKGPFPTPTPPHP